MENIRRPNISSQTNYSSHVYVLIRIQYKENSANMLFDLIQQVTGMYTMDILINIKLFTKYEYVEDNDGDYKNSIIWPK